MSLEFVTRATTSPFPHGEGLVLETQQGGFWQQALARWSPDLDEAGEWLDSIRYWGEVNSEDRQRFRNHATDVSDYFASLFGAMAEPQIHVAPDDVSGAVMFAEVRSADLNIHCAHAATDEILLKLRCHNVDRTEDGTYAHEYFHTLQSDEYQPRYLTSVSEYEDGPAWLLEGGATYAQTLYLDVRDITPYDVSRADILRSVQTRTGTLYDARLRTRPATIDVYYLGMLAAELLVHKAGKPSLIDYYRNRGDYLTIEETFEATFGLTLESFYEEFAEWRVGGFQRIEDAN